MVLSVGTRAPGFTVKDTNGNTISLLNFAGKTVVTPESCPSELSFALKIDKSIKETNDDFLKLNLINRFTDVWGFFSIFSGYQIKEQEVA